MQGWGSDTNFQGVPHGLGTCQWDARDLYGAARGEWARMGVYHTLLGIPDVLIVNIASGSGLTQHLVIVECRDCTLVRCRDTYV